MKILFVRDRNILNTKWLVSFANLLSQQGHQICVVGNTYGKVGSGSCFEASVKFINLNAKTNNWLINIYRKFRGKFLLPYFRFNKIIKSEKPDLIICYFPADLFNVTFFQNHNIPIIQMIHNYPPALFNRYLSKKFIAKYFYIKSFRKVSTFQVLLQSYINLIPKIFNPKKVEAIPNIVFPCKNEDIADLSNEKYKIIYVARVEEKGKRQHLILDAFAKIAKDFQNWDIEFWGLCKYEKYNEKLLDIAVAYGIQRQVFIQGYSENINEVYKNADIHAFPSLREGFGLGLADGMAAGLPSLGFIDSPGVNELIVDGHNGFLVKDINDFAEKLKKLILDRQLRISMGTNAIKDMDKYKPEKVIAMWDSLIKETVEKYYA